MKSDILPINKKSLSSALIKAHRVKQRHRVYEKCPDYNKDARLSDFILRRQNKKDGHMKGMLMPFVDLASNVLHPVIRLNQSRLNVSKILTQGRTFVKINYFYTPYLKYLYQNKDWDNLSEYIYVLYNDVHYFMKMHYMRLCDIMFSHVFMKCGCEHDPFFKNLFVANYHDLLTHTVTKMKRASFPKFDINKSNIVTFTQKAFIQVFVTGWLDLVESHQSQKKKMEHLIVFHSSVDMPVENFVHQHGFDLLLELSTH